MSPSFNSKPVVIDQVKKQVKNYLLKTKMPYIIKTGDRKTTKYVCQECKTNIEYEVILHSPTRENSNYWCPNIKCPRGGLLVSYEFLINYLHKL